MAKPAKRTAKSAAPTDAELQERSKHVVYEWEMLLQLANFLRKPPTLGDNQTLVEYACLESFVMHGRQIALFFHEERVAFPRDTDIYALQYAATWPSVKPRWTPALEALKTDADRRIAHLTTHRVDNVPRPVQQWAYELGQHIKTFEAVASPSLFIARRSTPVPELLLFGGEGVRTTTSQYFGEVLLSALPPTPKKKSK
jgi:hypothetical protein